MTTQQPEALAADHSEQTLEMVARWYMIDKDGMATLCTDREDAEKEAKDANMAWPHTAPHRAVQLVDVASVAASAGSEPVARVNDDGFIVEIGDLLIAPGQKLYLPSSPPEGMVGGWTKASQQLPPCRDNQLYVGINTAGFAGVFNAVIDIAGNVHCTYVTPMEVIDVMGSLDIWLPLTPPTTSAGSGKGE